ncbi:TetR/AcrR family transcriptional regulator [Actinomadura harenae]|uniref:TetR family transcriptional regulator n=1 Tax=Actinomadura harenae TaxID=2483351 RepID=A0A3M2M6Q9_9ACTN|nr:TetR/AcrR family transcriptional regulator [Actinomadura harenae]RMI44660.1 TetR family transcriptional regulator [Actinomadura harenae]
MTTPDHEHDLLLGAFARTVAERGYPRTRPRDVADAAGLSEAAFHARFTDLDDCFVALYRHCTGLLRSRADAAFRAAGSDWRAGLSAALGTVLAMIAASPEHARACLLDVSSAGPRVRLERLRFLGGLRGLLRGPSPGPVPDSSPGPGRDRGPASGPDPAPEPDPGALPDVVRDAIIGGLYGTVYARVAAGRTRELPDLAPALAAFTLGYFAASDAAVSR